MKERKIRYTIALSSSKDIFFYNGTFLAADKFSPNEFKEDDFIEFQDDKVGLIYFQKNMIIWIMECKFKGWE